MKLEHGEDTRINFDYNERRVVGASYRERLGREALGGTLDPKSDDAVRIRRFLQLSRSPQITAERLLVTAEDVADLAATVQTFADTTVTAVEHIRKHTASIHLNNDMDDRLGLGMDAVPLAIELQSEVSLFEVRDEAPLYLPPSFE